MRVSKIALATGIIVLLPMSAHAKFVSPDPVGFKEGGVDYFNRYAYAINDPINKFDPDGRQACGAVGEEVGSTCIEASNFNSDTVIDNSTVTQSDEITTLVNISTGIYETKGNNEGVFEVFENDEFIGMRQNFTATTNSNLETDFTPSNLEIDAIMHTHPTDKSTFGPGPGDDGVVRSLGVTNNIQHGSGSSGRAGHVGMVNGQFFFRTTQGKLTGGDKSAAQSNLRDFQRRNQGK